MRDFWADVHDSFCEKWNKAMKLREAGSYKWTIIDTIEAIWSIIVSVVTSTIIVLLFAK